VIRPLTDEDAAPLAARLAPLPLLQRYRRTAEALERDLRAALARGDGLLVHDAGGGADGLVWFLPSGTLGMGGYLRLLAVAPGANRRGLGGDLLAAFEASVARWSGHAFLLVSDFNDGAQRFYQRHGYVQVGLLPALVLPDVDELLFWRRLPRR
jgi:ribosomal protein S18 acetylase RimI-like enzyme